MGHKDIAIITGSPNHYTSNGRLNGYKKAMTNAGLTITDDYIQCGDYCIDGGYEAMMRLCKLQKDQQPYSSVTMI